ncbi:hypothetical protein N9139_02295, partial [Akkermansiaceae bacterium]|nr:hypothetical protein [Akkermansiaceae bacterium]
MAGNQSRPSKKGPQNSPLEKRVLFLISGDEGRPMNKSELARELDLQGKKRTELREVLRAMEKAQTIFYGKKGRFSTSRNQPKDRKNAGENREKSSGPRKGGKSGGAPVLVGVIRLNPAGHGWFMPSQTNEENLKSGIDLSKGPRFYVASEALSTSLDGDTVEAKLVKPTGRPPQGRKADMRARVMKIVERRSGKVTGTFRQDREGAFLESDDSRVPEGTVLFETAGAKNGQIVVVEITEWNDINESPRGKVVEVLGFPGDSGVDVEQIIATHGVARGFPPEVKDEALAVPDTVSEEEIKRREDWRKKDVITIDPETAKDFDDAIWVKKLE